MFNRLLTKLFRLIPVALRENNMSAKTDDFQPLPQYEETSTSNQSWVNVTVTKTDSDGNVSQTSTIVSKKS
jgi:hypothetical protein